MPGTAAVLGIGASSPNDTRNSSAGEMCVAATQSNLPGAWLLLVLLLALLLVLLLGLILVLSFPGKLCTARDLKADEDE